MSETEDFVIDDGIRMDPFFGVVYPDEAGKYAYINSTSKDTIELVDLESGKITSYEGDSSDYQRFFWHDNYFIIYGEKKIEVLDSSKGSKILSVKGEDIINCGMNDNMLYYLNYDIHQHLEEFSQHLYHSLLFLFDAIPNPLLILYCAQADSNNFTPSRLIFA